MRFLYLTIFVKLLIKICLESYIKFWICELLQCCFVRNYFRISHGSIISRPCKTCNTKGEEYYYVPIKRRPTVLVHVRTSTVHGIQYDTYVANFFFSFLFSSCSFSGFCNCTSISSFCTYCCCCCCCCCSCSCRFCL